MNEKDRKKYLEEVKNNLIPDQIFQFLTDLGGEPQFFSANIIVSRTICHNPPGEGSHKLYYYDNTKLFRCYTHCDDTFDIFELVLKIKRHAQEKIVYWAKGGIQETRLWELPDALHYVLMYFGLEEKNENFFQQSTELPEEQYFANKLNNQLKKSNVPKVSLKVYKKDLLKNFPTPRIRKWEQEGINKEALSLHNICYDPIHQGIIIPHYDINNNLIGIRERTLIKENEKYGKYRPATISGVMYNHPLSFNLYNINWSKDNIKAIKKAIIF